MMTSPVSPTLLHHNLGWPVHIVVVARAYVDQLEGSNGLSTERLQAVRRELDRAEAARGQARREALTRLATMLGQEAASATDRAKVQKLAAVVTELAGTMGIGAQ